MADQVVLVAFVVSDAEDHEEAQRFLMPHLPRPTGSAGANGVFGLESWWCAEDDRIDGSDNDSAVFVRPGAQRHAFRLLLAAGLTDDHNLPAEDICFEDPAAPTTETPERLAEMVTYMRGLSDADRVEIAWALGEAESTEADVPSLWT